MLVLSSQILIDHGYLVEHGSILLDLVDKALQSPILFYLLEKIRLDQFHLLALRIKLHLELFVFRFELPAKVLLALQTFCELGYLVPDRGQGGVQLIKEFELSIDSPLGANAFLASSAAIL